MAVNSALDSTMIATQPVVFGVAGMAYLGFTVNEWILMGSGVLLILNLALVPWRMYNEYKRSNQNGNR